MSVGIRNVFRVAANQAVTNSAVLVNATGLTINVAAGQELHFRMNLIFSVGAAGGCRFQVTGPAGLASFINSILLVNTVAPTTVPGVQTAPAAFNNALANAGNHYINMEGTLVNGATAGAFLVQFAQDTANATPITLLRGSWLETVGGPF